MKVNLFGVYLHQNQKRSYGKAKAFIYKNQMTNGLKNQVERPEYSSKATN